MTEVLEHDTDQYFSWHIFLKGYKFFKETNCGLTPINKASLFHAFPQYRTKPKELLVELDRLNFQIAKSEPYEQN